MTAAPGFAVAATYTILRWANILWLAYAGLLTFYAIVASRFDLLLWPALQIVGLAGTALLRGEGKMMPAILLLMLLFAFNLAVLNSNLLLLA
ncbi:hypothetical protein Q9Q95_18780 [Sphingomonas sp. DG1-23]|uniref:hypothetical protein n=1 Tax=Sphingomonas sp. DG1-23 TaxID=3068316 RepID=UPI00273E4E4E|nr:hypothetical protein [Sphingomonas sp. DG1-23]MDP5280977.1 hypothetical protein [Sphingomonas sp. DG1-23]